MNGPFVNDVRFFAEPIPPVGNPEVGNPDFHLPPDQTNKAGSKRKSTKMSLAEWLLQILMHEENKNEESGYDGHDQLLLNQGEGDPDRSKESDEKGLNLANLLSPFVLKRTEKDGSETKYLVDEDLENGEEGLNLEYSDDDEDEELPVPDQNAENGGLGLGLGHLFLPLPTQEKGNKKEDEELHLLNMIMGHHQ